MARDTADLYAAGMSLSATRHAPRSKTGKPLSTSLASVRSRIAAPASALIAEAQAAADGAGLHYVTDESPGITRLVARRDFVYADANGKRVIDTETLARIRSLAIPPAWSDVWICPDARGHLQATGRDQRGRKQYRYHPTWREVRDGAKFSRTVAFGRAHSPPCRPRSSPFRPRPGKGSRGDGAPAGNHAHPHRQRRIS